MNHDGIAAAADGMSSEEKVADAIRLLKEIDLRRIKFLRPSDEDQAQALMDEYERRNLLCAKAYGAFAEARYVLDRLSKMERCPQWLWEKIKGIEDRTAPLGKALADWRDGK